MLLITIIAITLVSLLSATVSIYIVENLNIMKMARVSKGVVVASLSTVFFLGLSLLLFLIVWPPYS